MNKRQRYIYSRKKFDEATSKREDMKYNIGDLLKNKTTKQIYMIVDITPGTQITPYAFLDQTKYEILSLETNEKKTVKKIWLDVETKLITKNKTE